MSCQVKLLHRVFSGIQPTGVPHLGNYFGALAQWIQLANEREVCVEGKKLKCDTPIFSIVDVHAYSSLEISSFGQQLYNNILSTAASLLAVGLDQTKCILFRQSDLYEHNYLDNVLDNFVTSQRLSHMTQFKDKSKAKSAPMHNGLLNYPVLQAADILLYKASLVPVGEDQTQHIELTRDIAQKFNSATSSKLFPMPQALLNECESARRIKSLRNPEKKMSKSDANKKSFIEIIDEPEVILEKCKKAVTDSISEVYYDADKRPGVSNLMRIYQLATNETLSEVHEQFRGLQTVDLKLRLADVLVEKFKPVRKEYKRLMNDQLYLESVLRLGESKAKPLAECTVSEVKHLLGSIRER